MDDTERPFQAALTESLAGWPISLQADQTARLFDHYRAIVVANRSLNLTRIIEPREAAVKHYADSLALWAWIQGSGLTVRSLLDVGTGAGFPAVPMAVAMPGLATTAIDGTRKKIDFLRGATAQCGIANIHAIHVRSEEWDTDRRFDIVAVRAVATLAKCVKQAARHVTDGGRLVVYKTDSLDAHELRAGEQMADRVGFDSEEPYPYELSVGSTKLSRSLHIYRASSPRPSGASR